MLTEVYTSIGGVDNKRKHAWWIRICTAGLVILLYFMCDTHISSEIDSDLNIEENSYEYSKSHNLQVVHCNILFALSRRCVLTKVLLYFIFYITL